MCKSENYTDDSNVCVCDVYVSKSCKDDNNVSDCAVHKFENLQTTTMFMFIDFTDNGNNNNEQL